MLISYTFITPYNISLLYQVLAWFFLVIKNIIGCLSHTFGEAYAEPNHPFKVKKILLSAFVFLFSISFLLYHNHDYYGMVQLVWYSSRSLAFIHSTRTEISGLVLSVSVLPYFISETPLKQDASIISGVTAALQVTLMFSQNLANKGSMHEL